MNKLTIRLLVAFLFVTAFFSACNELDDNYSTNPSHRLAFSVDTLTFDTVFTTIGSATRQFMIYNPNSEPVNVESIMLAGAGSSGFRINVDGRRGDSFSDVGILAKDSMYVFVEVTVDPNEKYQPLQVIDSVMFTLNGNRQRVVLEAFGQDVYLYKGGKTITKDTTLTADRPYLVYDSLVVNPGVTVNIEEGATFYMHDRANLVVHGTLKVNGSQDKPVTFRGDRLDFILNDILPYDRAPGQWGGIFFASESYNNTMDYVYIRNGQSGMTFLPSSPDRPKLKITNSQITNMDGNLLTAINCQIELINSELSNATGTISALMGGKYHFIHCTLANYMTYKSRNDSLPQVLVLSNALPEKQTAPLNVTFDNCIIDGNRDAGSKPLTGEILLSPEENIAFEYQFNHCVIKTKSEENPGAAFSNVLFVSKSPAYRMLGGEKNKYQFDFRLDSATTVGVGKADLLISRQYPEDRYGVSRIDSPDGPTIGAYEFVAAEEEEE
ncbi:hypothetical protein [Parabacteroides sp. PF5-9]|uniref:hypothetical protein n=1 Tax=Parabacteroides sp. PF5-9 TaxID=1742404 RepID=UPI00247704AE|nr:hypothetical protein [Parabacteroides sp. PF5-9]MDH6358645.1 hypothetical protein [Parabacteroides sp. PF5-9]